MTWPPQFSNAQVQFHSLSIKYKRFFPSIELCICKIQCTQNLNLNNLLINHKPAEFVSRNSLATEVRENCHVTSKCFIHLTQRLKYCSIHCWLVTDGIRFVDDGSHHRFVQHLMSWGTFAYQRFKLCLHRVVQHTRQNEKKISKRTIFFIFHMHTYQI